MLIGTDTDKYVYENNKLYYMKGNQETAQCATEILDVFNNLSARNLLYRL